jgi:uncharacterized membrane protein
MSSGGDMITELEAYVEADRITAHRHHWLAKTKAEHQALNDFYDDVIEALDTLVENYIGLFAPFAFVAPVVEEVTDIKKHLTARGDWIEANRELIAQGSDSLGALVDNLVTVYTHTVYMLRFK